LLCSTQDLAIAVLGTGMASTLLPASAQVSQKISPRSIGGNKLFDYHLPFYRGGVFLGAACWARRCKVFRKTMLTLLVATSNLNGLP